MLSQETAEPVRAGFGVVYHFELDREYEHFNLKGIMYEDQGETLILFKQ